MAIDEALLESCARGACGFPCLRLYAFEPPCLSLGFSQVHAEAADLRFCRNAGIDLVRRPTGGRAVLHEFELTYAVVGRQNEPPFQGGVLAIYRSVARALIAGFRKLGVNAAVSDQASSDGSPRTGVICFAEPARHEIAAGAWKIAGSALARRRGAFLQHGSIPIRLEMDRLAAATGHRRPGGAGAPDAAGLDRILHRRIEAGELGRSLVAGFEEALGARMAPGDLSAEERLLSERLRADRYLTAAWTFRQ